MQSLKLRTTQLLWLDPDGDRAAIALRRAIAALILLNVALVILETVESINRPYAAVFEITETISVVIFTVEYLLRLWSAPLASGFHGSRFRFLISPLGIVDVLAILPFYLPLLFPFDLRFLRILRLLRLLRVLKLGHYSDALQRLGTVLYNTRRELTIIIVVLTTLLILAGGLMYIAEHDAQPEKFSSIPASMWYGVVTFTTVGYGDVTPVTPIGKCLSAVMALLGIGLFALPTGVISSELMTQLKPPASSSPQSCPHCGKPLA